MPRPFGLRPFSPFRYNPYRIGTAFLDYGYRRYFDPAFDAPPSMPASWRIRHGPNVYPFPYNGKPKGWSTGYVVDSQPSGPQTGVITGQAAYRLARLSPLARLLQNFPGTNRWSAGIPHITDNSPGANAMTIVRDPSPPHDALPPARNFLVPQLVPVPAPVPALQPYRPLPPWRQLPLFNPMPWAVPSPRTPSYPEPYPVPRQRPGTRPERSPQPDPLLPLPDSAPENPPMPVQDFPPVEVPNVQSWETVIPMGRRAPRPLNRRGPPTHRREPPKQRDRENKGKMGRGLWNLLNAFGVASEGMDLVDAAWNALPRDRRSRSFHKGQYVRPNWRTRIGDVYRNWQHIDMDRFARNVVANQLEDAYYGISGRFWNPTGGRPMPNNDTRREIDEASPVGDSPIDFDKVVDEIWRALAP